MMRYIASRLAGGLLTLVIASIITFAIIELPPGDYRDTLRAELQQINMGPEQIEDELARAEARFALSAPVYVRYLTWIKGVITGDLGYSPKFRRPIMELIQERLGLTIMVSTLSLAVTTFIGVWVGVFTAIRAYSIWDHSITAVAFVALAVPNFLIAILVTFVWVVAFNGTPLFGIQSPQYVFAPWSLERVLDLINHLWLPVVVIGAAHSASTIRVVRARMLDSLHEPFLQTARMKGISETRAVFVHALRVAINPVVTGLGLALPGIISGEVITSIVLQLNTIGPLLLEALLSQDMYLSATILLMLTLLLVIGNLLADLAIGWLDPRIRSAR